MTNKIVLPEVYIQPKMSLIMDSGAHSMYYRWFSGVKGRFGHKGGWARENAQYEYTKSDVFKNYLECYIQYLNENKHLLDLYVTLDVIGHAEKSWEILKYMESCGLNPIPVYHFGEDIKWLKKMVDNYNYIGVGCIGQDISKVRFKPFADNVFEVVTGKNAQQGFGKPKVKIHGFAMGSVEMMLRYPFYSCDQSTWTFMGRNGSIQVPKWTLDKNLNPIDFNYLVHSTIYGATDNRSNSKAHHFHRGSSVTLALENYLNIYGYTLDDVATRYLVRDVINYKWYRNMSREVKQVYEKKFDYKEGANLYFAGMPGSCVTKFENVAKLFYSVKDNQINYLATYFYPQFLVNCVMFKNYQMQGANITEAVRNNPEFTKVNPRDRDASIIKKQTIESRKLPRKHRKQIQTTGLVEPIRNRDKSDLKLSRTFNLNSLVKRTVSK